MHEQARFALEKGVPDALVQENGDLVRLAPGVPKIVERVRSGRLILDGDVILPAEGETINERRSWRSTAISPLPRSEEHTSELQSLMRISYAVFCLKKKNLN